MGLVSDPMDVVTEITLEECLTYCRKHGCKAVQYAISTMQCDLYDVNTAQAEREFFDDGNLFELICGWSISEYSNIG